MTDQAILAAVVVFILRTLYDIQRDVRTRRNGSNGLAAIENRLNAIQAEMLRIWQRLDEHTAMSTALQVKIARCQSFHRMPEEQP